MKNTDIRIRPYEEGDFVRLCEIHDPARKKELGLAELPDAFLPLSVAAEREELFDYQVYVAEYRGTVAGFTAFTREEIAWLYVDVNHTRKGIGGSLIRFALEQVSEDAAIEVLAGNAPAIALYSSFGFQIRETLTGRMPGNERFAVTVHVMQKIAGSPV